MVTTISWNLWWQENSDFMRYKIELETYKLFSSLDQNEKIKNMYLNILTLAN